jgi:hypothetical protein
MKRPRKRHRLHERSVQLNVRLSKEEMRTIEEIAKPAGLSAPDVVRVLILREQRQEIVRKCIEECIDRGDPVPSSERAERKIGA